MGDYWSYCSVLLNIIFAAGKVGMVRSSEDHVGQRGGSDGDGIAIFTSSNIWIDHCFLASCTDGLIDVIHASTSITISNNYFTKHDKVSRTNFNLSISLFDHTHTHMLYY